MPVWGGIYLQIRNRIENGSFGLGFPLECQDGFGVWGCDIDKMALAVKAEIPSLEWPLKPDNLPSMFDVFDLIEMLYRHVGNPVEADHHPYWNHYHLRFEQEEGQTDFRKNINRIFARNGIAFELTRNGQIIRLAPEVLREELDVSAFHTGDETLDNLLNAARNKFLNPSLDTRRESLEKLWDAWERLKTLEIPKDKKKSIDSLIAKVSSEVRTVEVLNSEAKTLTNIGNDFMIRHTEVGKTPVSDSHMVDYLFHRLFALILLLLRGSGKHASVSDKNLSHDEKVNDQSLDAPF